MAQSNKFNIGLDANGGSGEVENRVANSGLITFNLEEHRPAPERAVIDLKDQLFQGMILREKDFRAFVKEHDWEQYRGKAIGVYCSADAIVPAWAFMLVATKLEGIAAFVTHGDAEALELELFRDALRRVDWEAYRDQKVVLKGCGEVTAPVYLEATRYLTPVVDKLMYGEPCSMVPLYRRPKAKAQAT